MKYSRIIAIDPDVEKSGVAELYIPDKLLNISSLRFPLLVEYLYHMKQKCDDVKVIVEAGWLNQSNWHIRVSDTKRLAAAKGNSTGRNHETGRKIIEMAEYIGLDVEPVKPIKKYWKGKDGKITHEELSTIVGGIDKRTSQDARDAALLAWWYAGLPIKIKL